MIDVLSLVTEETGNGVVIGVNEQETPFISIKLKENDLRHAIQEEMKENKTDRSVMAKELGLGRTYLYELIREEQSTQGSLRQLIRIANYLVQHRSKGDNDE